ncbi:MAG TPA: hypothetical protein VM840_13600 [Actinomycetota bacterium]|nr:hypothetical protein [Actinomycetota bacterium]
MAARRESMALTDAYRRALVRVRGSATRILLDLFDARVRVDDIDRTVRRWTPAAAETVVAGQREAVRLTSAYLTAYMASETGEPQPPQDLDLEAFEGTAGGLELAAVLRLTGAAMKHASAAGLPPAAVRLAGEARAVRTVRAEVMGAARRALADAMHADPRIVGWTRVTWGTCGACLGLSGTSFASNVRMDTHPNCRCVAEPRVAGVRERWRRPTGEEIFARMSRAEQDALFAGRGGADKADLVRSGAVPLHRLVRRYEHPEWGSVLSEAPLAELQKTS